MDAIKLSMKAHGINRLQANLLQALKNMLFCDFAGNRSKIAFLSIEDRIILESLATFPSGKWTRRIR